MALQRFSAGFGLCAKPRFKIRAQGEMKLGVHVVNSITRGGIVGGLTLAGLFQQPPSELLKYGVWLLGGASAVEGWRLSREMARKELFQED